MKRQILLALPLFATLALHAQIKVNVPGLATPAAGDSVLDTNNNHKVIACNSNAVWVRGNNNHLNITGDCQAVHVLGNNNAVAIDKAAAVSTEGNRNNVTYRNEDAKVSNPGTANHVAKVR